MRPHHVLAVLLLAPASSAAQSTVAERAFVALRATHIGALTPMPGPAMVGRQLNGAQLGIRYGFHRESNVNTHAVAGSGIFAGGTNSNVSLHAGVSDADCDGCTPEMLLGLSGEMRVAELGDPVGGSSLHIGVSGDVGYAQLKPDRSALALGVGAPVVLTMHGGGSTGMRIVPFFTPMLGIGQVNDCGAETCSGTRLVLGGGIALWNPLTSVSASLGVNHVVLEGQGPVFGVNVVFGGR
jgi:hypothetical protein